MNFVARADIGKSGETGDQSLSALYAMSEQNWRTTPSLVPPRQASGLSLTWRAGLPFIAHNDGAHRRQFLAKRAFDIVGAIMALVFLAPLLIIVAIAIKVSSPGPVLFRQQREGVDGKLFGILKFRSMRRDVCDNSGVTQTIANDTRVTGVGRFIRRTSIDELPQLLNVLVGDMSLVGPRPHVPGMRAGGISYKALVPYYDYRLVMRPGITGWAQVNGLRGETRDAARAQARIDHDLAYVQNFSLSLDIKIVALTVVREFLTGSSV
jgi:lipopolysaccharide/colanic/teichoic acid biosynthesis glycosyltransferase